MSTAALAAQISKGVFELSPHKIAICHLIQVFGPPAENALPVPFFSVSDHNRLGLFLFAITRCSDDFVDPSLSELIIQLKGINSPGDFFTEWQSQNLVDRLKRFSSPDDLFTFFDKLRGLLPPTSSVNYGDDRTYLDPLSHLGVFLRCCLLAFSVMTFEAVCHLLTNIGIYCSSVNSENELPEEEYDEAQLREFLENDDIDLDGSDCEKYDSEFDTRKVASGNSSFHIQAPKSLYEQAEVDPKSKMAKNRNPDRDAYPLNDDWRDDDRQGGLFLRSKWQVLGYMNEQADLLEKHSSSLPLDSFDAVLKQLQKMAPELHRVRYLQYLNSFYHDDYLTALDNLHCYFDYSAGMEGVFTGSPTSYVSDLNLGKYESALLCLGTMHCHFGHSKQALEALTEAVRISQLNNDDSCLAYTLTTICNLLSEIGISNSNGVVGSPYTLGTDMGMGMPLSTQQQLFVLLKKSQKRAEDLKLTCLVGFNRLTLAKFELKNVKMPLLSFGPKAPTKLRTSPVKIYKELSLSSYLFSEFGSDGISPPNDNVTFSTAWIKNLSESRGSFLSSLGHGLNNFDAFHYSAQPNPIPGSVLQLAGASYLLKATSWELYGSAPLVRLNTLIYLSCFADAASSTDLSLAYVKLIQHVALFKGYKAAFSAMKSAEEKFACVSKSRIQLLKLQLHHEYALHSGRLKFAEELGEKFSVLCSSVAGVDIELKTEAGFRHARTLLAADQFKKAADLAHYLFCKCYKYNLHVENASILLLLAEIHKKSGNAVLGLPYALASLSYCQSFNLDLLEASATLSIAELWLALGSTHAQAAESLLNRSLPMIFGHGGLELCARANILVAKCHLSDPSFSVQREPDIVLESLKQAAEDSEILEYHEMAAEAFYLMAMVYNLLGLVKEREEAAFSFKRHMLAFEEPEDGDDMPSHLL